MEWGIAYVQSVTAIVEEIIVKLTPFIVVWASLVW